MLANIQRFICSVIQIKKDIMQNVLGWPIQSMATSNGNVTTTRSNYEHLRSEVTSVGLVVRAYGSNQARGNEMLDNDMLMNSLFYGDQLQQGVVPAMDRTKMRMLLILSVTSTQYRLKTLTVILPPIR
uniref:Uncharacterized protein n=1 Tax=Oryza nivara TaxID=4536 RepID=A0A0E0HE06_ORYNI